MTYACTVLDQAAPADVPESVLQLAVIQRATELGYSIFWLPDALQRIAVAADRFDTMPRPGYVDLTIVGHGRLLHIELKAERGRLRPEQRIWRDEFQRAGADWRLWRPSDWQTGEIEAVLRGRS